MLTEDFDSRFNLLTRSKQSYFHKFFKHKQHKSKTLFVKGLNKTEMKILTITTLTYLTKGLLLHT